jgi:hypothetical protein
LDDLERRLGFIDQDFAGFIAHGHLEMQGHPGGGGGGNGAGRGGGVFIGGKGPVVTLPLAGMVIFSPQEGQSIWVPAPD